MEGSNDKPKKQNLIATEISLVFKRIGAYITAALKDFSRSPLTIFFTIAYPIILILLFGAIFSDEGFSSDPYVLYLQSGSDEGYQISPVQRWNFTDDFITTLEEMKRNRELAWCCGSGGGVKIGYPEWALEVATERVKEAEVTGTNMIVSTCPFCKTNLEDAVKASKSKMQVIDLVEILDKYIP